MRKITTLVVSGCSFTAHMSWAYFFARHHDLKLINLAWPGAGNNHISKSVILYLEKNKIHRENLLVLVMWSSLFRKDWIRDYRSKYGQLYTDFEYDKGIRLVIPSMVLEKTKSRFGNADALDISYGNDINSQILDSWLAIDHLNCYLRSNDYRYFQTNFYDPFVDQKNTSIQMKTNYVTSLSKFGLDIEYPNFLDLAHDEYLGNYVYNKNLIAGEYDVHPNEKGHQEWASEILIKKINDL